MRVAISSKNFSGYNGSARIISELSRRFSARGDSVDIVGNTINKQPILDCAAHPVEIKKFLFGKKLSRDAYMEKHKAYARKSGHDLYIGNGDEAVQDILVMHNCVNLQHEKFNNIPSVGDTYVRNVSRIHGQVLKNRWFKKLVANSGLMKKDFSTRYQVPEEMIRVIHPAYDHSIFNHLDREKARAEFRAKHGIPTEREFMVGQVMSGDFSKRGVKSFFNVYRMLPPELAAKVHLVIVGKDKLAKFVEDIPPNLTFIPHTDDPASIMRSLDVMLYPAILEEFGLVISETIACGTPVFSSRMVGATELFTGLHAEALCDGPDEEHFAQKLARFLSDKSYRDALTAETSSMMSHLTWDRYFDEFNAVVDEVMREKQTV